MNGKRRHCFFFGKPCDEWTDYETPHCFIAITFRMKKELQTIKTVLNRLKIEPIVANHKLPQFLFHDICSRISKSMFGVFEVTKVNENVFGEWGIMAGQGKPAILLYNCRKRKKLKSDYEGIIQSRYRSRNEIRGLLLDAITSSSWKMEAPEGSVLQISLLSSKILDRFPRNLRRAKFNARLPKLKIKRAADRDRGEYLSFKVEVNTRLKKNRVNLDAHFAFFVGAYKNMVHVEVRKFEDSFKVIRLRKGRHRIPDSAKKLMDQAEAVWANTVNSIEHDFQHP
jgi:hypothetical protein